VRSAWALRRKAEELENDLSSEPDLLGEEDVAHPAAAQLFQDAVLVADRGLKPVLEIDRSAPEGDACKVRRLETEG